MAEPADQVTLKGQGRENRVIIQLTSNNTPDGRRLATVLRTASCPSGSPATGIRRRKDAQLKAVVLSSHDARRRRRRLTSPGRSAAALATRTLLTHAFRPTDRATKFAPAQTTSRDDASCSSVFFAAANCELPQLEMFAVASLVAAVERMYPILLEFVWFCRKLLDLSLIHI